jgi:hypothetical protein
MQSNAIFRNAGPTPTVSAPTKAAAAATSAAVAYISCQKIIEH